MHVVYVAGVASFQVLAAPAAMIVVGGLLVSKLTAAGRHFLAGERVPWRPHVIDVCWALFALMCLGAIGGVANAGATASKMYEEVFNGFLGPLVGVSVDTGAEIMNAIAEEVEYARHGPDLTPEEKAKVRSASLLTKFHKHVDGSLLDPKMDRVDEILGISAPDPDRDVIRYDFTRSLIRMTLSIEQVAVIGIARGVAYMLNLGGLSNLHAWTFIIIGVVLVIVFLQFFLVAGLHFLDPLLRMALFCALLLVLLACLPFAPLRTATALPSFRVLGYVAVFCLVLGIVYAMILALMLTSFAAVTTPGITLTDLYSKFVSHAYMTDTGAEAYETHLPVVDPGNDTGGRLVDLPGAFVLLVATGFAGALYPAGLQSTPISR